MYTQIGGPHLPRVDADAEGALSARRIRSAAVLPKLTLIINLVDDVGVYIATARHKAVACLHAEDGNGGLDGRRNPDTRGLRSRSGLDKATLLVDDVPAVQVEEGHKVCVRLLGEILAVEDVLCGRLHLEMGGKGLGPELLLHIRPVLLLLLLLNRLVDDRLVVPVRGLHLTDPAVRAWVGDVLILPPLSRVLRSERDDRSDSCDNHLILHEEGELVGPRRLRTATGSTRAFGRSPWVLDTKRTLCGRVHLGVC